MNQNQHLQDLREIKEIMSRSSKFLSMSGISGVMAGLYALTGAFLAYRTVYQDQDYLSYQKVTITFDSLTQLLLIAMVVLVLSIGTGIYFSYRKARKSEESLWNEQTARVLVNLLIPLVTGGLLCLIFLFRGYVGVIAPLTLIFYGLALVNASKYTMSEIRSLGIFEVILGLVAMQFIGFGLLMWAVGFGLLHIIYGAWMYLKYER